MRKRKISFSSINPAFYATLRKNVDEYFTTKAIKFTGNRRLYLKTIILLTLLVGLYTVLLFFTPPVWVSVILCMILGLNLAAIGFNVMHDGAHGSYSRKPWVNEVMAYSLNLMGGSSYLWKQKHNINHHSFTNIEGLDDDIDIQPWIRTNVNQKRRWFHRYQHIYWVVLYGLTYLTWVFNKDFGKYFSGKIAHTSMKKMSVKEHFIFWISKIIYFGIFLIIPIFKVGLIETIAGYSIACFVCGWTLSVVFQMAHVVPISSFPMPNEESHKIEQDWAIHQIATTVNFSTRSKIVSWFAGGLNFQVEHHLFPKISHVHYPAINKIVKEACTQFNIRYNEYVTFFGALRSHSKHLKMVGAK